MKKTILFFFLFISTFSIGQTKEDTTVMWFKYIHKVDQTYIKTEFIRNQIFVNNFELINSQIKNGNLKKNLLSGYKKKSVFEIKIGFEATLIHISQTNPALIWNNDYVSFIENEIKNNDLDSSLFIRALELYHYNMTYYQVEKNKNKNYFADIIDHQYDSLFFEALKRWGIEELVNKKAEDLKR
jgi:hypothetical protein